MVRRLLAVADTPGDARREASAALDEADTWWLLGRPSSWQSMNYEKFLVRRDDVQRVLVLLADLAAHRTPTLPPGARIEDGGIIWPLNDQLPLLSRCLREQGDEPTVHAVNATRR